MLLQRDLRAGRPSYRYEAAVLAYRAGEFDDCIVGLPGSSVDNLILRARCFYRLQLADEAFAALTAAVDRATDEAQISEALIVKGFTLSALGDFEQAESVLANARAHAYLSGISVLRAEAEYASALLFWSQNRMQELRDSAQRVLAIPVNKVTSRGTDSGRFITGDPGSGLRSSWCRRRCSRKLFRTSFTYCNGVRRVGHERAT